MYIKIKNIKKILLIAACILFAGVNYLTYVKADTTNKVCSKSIDADCDGLTDSEEQVYGTSINNMDTDGDGYSDGIEIKSGYDPKIPAPGDRVSTMAPSDDQKLAVSNKETLTDSFSKEFQSYLTSKGNTAISASDIDDFVEEQLSDNFGAPISFDNLPQIDESKIKILKQEYSSISEEDRKQRQKKDAEKYLLDVAYLLVSNAPKVLDSQSDFQAIKQEFEANLKKLSDPNYDGQYFLDLSVKVEMLVSQMESVEVPETMLSLHVKFLRMAKGLLELKDAPSTVGDPMGRIVTVSKASGFFTLYADFFQNDFHDYFEQLKTN